MLCHLCGHSIPEHTKDMMAYLRLMVREGYRHGGSGRLKYDSINNSGPSASWDILDPSLLTIVVNQGLNPRLPCYYCQKCDHAAYECALPLWNNPQKCKVLSSGLPLTPGKASTQPPLLLMYQTIAQTHRSLRPLCAGFASHGTVGSVHSQAHVAMLMSASHATAEAIGLVTVL